MTWMPTGMTQALEIKNRITIRRCCFYLLDGFLLFLLLVIVQLRLELEDLALLGGGEIFRVRHDFVFGVATASRTEIQSRDVQSISKQQANCKREKAHVIEVRLIIDFSHALHQVRARAKQVIGGGSQSIVIIRFPTGTTHFRLVRSNSIQWDALLHSNWWTKIQPNWSTNSGIHHNLRYTKLTNQKPHTKHTSLSLIHNTPQRA